MIHKLLSIPHLTDRHNKRECMREVRTMLKKLGVIEYEFYYALFAEKREYDAAYTEYKNKFYDVIKEIVHNPPKYVSVNPYYFVNNFVPIEGERRGGIIQKLRKLLNFAP